MSGKCFPDSLQGEIDARLKASGRSHRAIWLQLGWRRIFYEKHLRQPGGNPRLKMLLEISKALNVELWSLLRACERDAQDGPIQKIPARVFDPWSLGEVTDAILVNLERTARKYSGGHGYSFVYEALGWSRQRFWEKFRAKRGITLDFLCRISQVVNCAPWELTYAQKIRTGL